MLSRYNYRNIPPSYRVGAAAGTTLAAANYAAQVAPRVADAMSKAIYSGARSLASRAYNYATAPAARKSVGLPINAYTRPRLVRKKPKTVKKRVALLEKQVREDLSRVIYKVDTKDTVRPTVSQALNGYREVCAISEIEASLAQARFFDPASPGTLITASLASPTYTQSIGVSVNSICFIKNNYQVPCYVYYAILKPKVATNTAPTTAWTNGLTDAGNPTSTSYLLTMKDSNEFTKTYKGKFYKKLLKPGQQIVLKTRIKMFDYDPSYFDTNTQQFQPKAKSTLIFYRVHGVLGHDTLTSTEQGVMPAGIDVHHIKTYTITYNSGGAAVKTIVLNQGAASSFTSAGVVSEAPVADNISYSVS